MPTPGLLLDYSFQTLFFSELSHCHPQDLYHLEDHHDCMVSQSCGCESHDQNPKLASRLLRLTLANPCKYESQRRLAASPPSQLQSSPGMLQSSPLLTCPGSKTSLESILNINVIKNFHSHPQHLTRLVIFNFYTMAWSAFEKDNRMACRVIRTSIGVIKIPSGSLGPSIRIHPILRPLPCSSRVRCLMVAFPLFA